ncbi:MULTISPECIES: hypothetical protein [Pseudomonas]|uniref:Uncharacterized protein n=1 Tax=Pseudomonas helleri TaxID=1608996 RepID=A0A6L5HMG7_9PSED|nr:hypothetical protein [Pseudomonas helleri]MQU04430.1 hypothetical protein [Pseudomonas helleri]
MIFTTISQSGEIEAGVLEDVQCKIYPFAMNEDGNHIEDTTRSYLESLSQKGFTNHLSINLNPLNGVRLADDSYEFFFLAHFEGRAIADESLILCASYDDATETGLLVQYTPLKQDRSTTERFIEDIEFRDAVNSFALGNDWNFLTFFDFTQSLNFKETVLTHKLLNY